MDRCEFCSHLAVKDFIVEMNKADEKVFGKPRLYHEYSVAFVDRFWRKGEGKRNAQVKTEFRWRDLGYRLNYCPECGRKISNV